MRRLAFLIIFSLSIFMASGQNNTNSPYSVFGIGELDNAAGGRNMGMGGSGIAMKSDVFLNLSNPASLTAIPVQSLETDAGITFKFSDLQNSLNSVNVLNGNISWAALAFPINRTFAMAMSLNPMSSVGYTISSIKSLDGANLSYPTVYKGQGGLSEASVSLGAQISKNFSLGLQSSVVWGNISETNLDSPPLGSVITRVNNSSYMGSSFKPGFQYQSRLNKNTVLTLAGTAKLSTYLNGSNDLTITSGSTLVLTELDVQNQLKLPVDMVFGLGLQFKEKYLFTADYNRSDWRKAIVNVDPTGLALNQSYHIGLEIAPKYDSQRLGQTRRYRFGAFYQTGYMVVSGVQISNYAASFGMAIPIRKDRNTMNFAIEAGKQGTLQNNLISIAYIKLNWSFSLWERWFIPRKYD